MVHSRPVLRAEHARHLYLSVGPLVLVLQAKSELIFENSEYFVPPPPSPLVLIERQPGLTLDVSSPSRLEAPKMLKFQVYPNNLLALFKRLVVSHLSH
jgi:hypothetical protein